MLSGEDLMDAAILAGYDVAGWNPKYFAAVLDEVLFDDDNLEIVPTGEPRLGTFGVFLSNTGTIEIMQASGVLTPPYHIVRPDMALHYRVRTKPKPGVRWNGCKHKREAGDKHCPVCIIFYRLVTE